MKLIDCLIPTKIANENMTIKEALGECVSQHVPGIPFADNNGKITGRFSIRNLFYTACIPADLIKHAHLLGNDIEHLDVKELNHHELLNKSSKLAVVDWIIHLSPDAPAVKALALMEQFDTPYLFVVDNNDHYLGVVTSMGIAEKLLEPF